jgi:hemoglobin
VCLCVPGVVTVAVTGPIPVPTPFDALGGETVVRSIVHDFYAIMARDEPVLARLHPCDENGRIVQESQDRFALFLIGWLGGPQWYMQQHGHPRLRMRHANVPVDAAMRDAWIRCMCGACEKNNVEKSTREFLDQKFAELAEFLRNRS